MSCAVCQAPLKKYRITCSRACSNTYRMEKKPKKYCSFCNKEINNRPRCWIRGKEAYCDKICEAENKKDRIKIKCIICKKEFETTKLASIKRKTCNRECWKEYFKQFILPKMNKRRSFGECFIAYMFKINFSTNLTIIENDRKQLDGFELDIFIPEMKVGIEYNGIHHYQPIQGDENLKRVVKIDRMKRGLAFKKGIKIYTIKTLESHSRNTKVKLINIFSQICKDLNLIPTVLDVDMNIIESIHKNVTPCHYSL